LSLSQHLWLEGVLGWGVGIFLYWQVSRYLEWLFEGYPWSRPSPIRVAVDLGAALAFGLVFGWFQWDPRNKQPV
jgi:hypothetical protein